jgi:hypothetical protein
MRDAILNISIGLSLLLSGMASAAGYKTVFFHAVPIGLGIICALIIHAGQPWWETLLISCGITYFITWFYYFARKFTDWV